MKPSPDAIVSDAVSIEVDAAPEEVYDLVADISRMGEWSLESTGGEWLNGGSGKVGDWFRGDNANPDRSWSRECQVAAATRGEDFTFVVLGMEKNCTWWSFEMQPAGTGTTLTQRWWVVNKTPAMAAATPEQFSQRAAYTRQMMEATVAGVRDAAEQSRSA